MESGLSLSYSFVEETVPNSPSDLTIKPMVIRLGARYLLQWQGDGMGCPHVLDASASHIA